MKVDERRNSRLEAFIYGFLNPKRGVGAFIDRPM
jgi:hypothetical protein